MSETRTVKQRWTEHVRRDCPQSKQSSSLPVRGHSEGRVRPALGPNSIDGPEHLSWLSRNRILGVLRDGDGLVGVLPLERADGRGTQLGGDDWHHDSAATPQSGHGSPERASRLKSYRFPALKRLGLRCRRRARAVASAKTSSRSPPC